MQASSACFTLSAIFADVLLIRIFLALAYIWLMAQAVCGYPIWPNYTFTGEIGVDTIAWSAVGLIIHALAIVRLVLDERPIRFRSEDERQMNAFMLRRSGMQPLEVRELLKKGTWKRFKAGETILNKVESICQAVLLVEGKAVYNRTKQGETISGHMYSGSFFDIGLLNVCGVYIGFEKDGTAFDAIAETDCLVFELTLASLNDLACNCGPSVSGYFRNFILSEVAWSWEFRTHSEGICEPPRTSRGFREPMEYFEGKRSRDFTDPLEDWEVHKSSVKGVLKWMYTSLAPFVPLGSRHTTLPVGGLAAKRRIMMIEEVKKELGVATSGIEGFAGEEKSAQQV